MSQPQANDAEKNIEIWKVCRPIVPPTLRMQYGADSFASDLTGQEAHQASLRGEGQWNKYDLAHHPAQGPDLSGGEDVG